MAVKDFDGASPKEKQEVREAIRSAIRAGKVEITAQARQQMEEKGLTEEEVIGMLMKKMGLDG